MGIVVGEDNVRPPYGRGSIELDRKVAGVHDPGAVTENNYVGVSFHLRAPVTDDEIVLVPAGLGLKARPIDVRFLERLDNGLFLFVGQVRQRHDCIPSCRFLEFTLARGAERCWGNVPGGVDELEARAGPLQMDDIHAGPLFGQVLRSHDSVAGVGIGFGAQQGDVLESGSRHLPWLRRVGNRGGADIDISKSTLVQQLGDHYSVVPCGTGAKHDFFDQLVTG